MSEIPRRFGRPTVEEAVELKQRVLDETFKALCINGAERLSMDQLARLAGVTKRTIYRQFGNKAGLVSAVVNRELDHMQKSTLEAADVEIQPLDALQHFARYILRHFTSDETLAFSNYLAFEAATDPEIRPRHREWHERVVDHCNALVELAQAKGSLAPAPPTAISLLLLDLICGLRNRQRLGLSDDELFGMKDAEAFFQSRWSAFLTLAGGVERSGTACARATLPSH